MHSRPHQPSHPLAARCRLPRLSLAERCIIIQNRGVDGRRSIRSQLAGPLSVPGERLDTASRLIPGKRSDSRYTEAHASDRAAGGVANRAGHSRSRGDEGDLSRWPFGRRGHGSGELRGCSVGGGGGGRMVLAGWRWSAGAHRRPSVGPSVKLFGISRQWCGGTDLMALAATDVRRAGGPAAREMPLRSAATLMRSQIDRHADTQVNCYSDTHRDR